MLLFVVLHFYSFANAKETICYISINSTHERELFKSYYPEANHVELVPQNESSYNKRDWFREACRSNIICDKLVISGHFGGIFVGESGFTLSTQELEKYSCLNSCDNIIKSPKEVYLFGCNTLATKDSDRRTLEEYVDVLVRDGFNPSDAQLFAALRYSPIGRSFKQSMESIFSNSNLLFGFDSIAPSGANVSEKLKTYLQLYTPEYSQKIWQSSLSYTHRTYSKGMASKDSLLCSFIEESDTLKILKISRDALNSSKKWDFIFLIQDALKDINISELLPEEFGVFQDISKNEKLKKEFYSMIKKIDSIPSHQFSLMKLGKKLDWLTLADLDEYVNQLVTRFSRGGLSSFETNVLCTLEYPYKVSLDLVNNYEGDLYSLVSALVCLGPQNSEVANEVFKIANNSTHTNEIQTGFGLGQSLLSLASLSKNKSEDVLSIIIPLLQSKYVRALALEVLSFQSVVNEEQMNSLIHSIHLICGESQRSSKSIFSLNTEVTGHSYSSTLDIQLSSFINKSSYLNQKHISLLKSTAAGHPECQLVQEILSNHKE